MLKKLDLGGGFSIMVNPEGCKPILVYSLGPSAVSVILSDKDRHELMTWLDNYEAQYGS